MRPCTPLPFIRKLITSTLSFRWLERNGRGFSLWGPVFPRVPFFSSVQGPGPDPVFRQCPKRWAVSETSKAGCAHCNDGCFQAFQTGIPVVYLSVTNGSHLMLERKNCLSKGKWEGTCLLNQTWGKETDTWWKVRTWKFADKIGWELILIILMFSLTFRSSLSSSNVGDSSLWFVSVSLLSTPNFEISMTSLHLNTSSIQYMSEIQVSLLSVFLRCSFVGFYWISNFLFRLQQVLHLSYFIYFAFYSIPYFITSSWFWRLSMFSFHFPKKSPSQITFLLFILVTTATTTAVLILFFMNLSILNVLE